MWLLENWKLHMWLALCFCGDSAGLETWDPASGGGGGEGRDRMKVGLGFGEACPRPWGWRSAPPSTWKLWPSHPHFHGEIQKGWSPEKRVHQRILLLHRERSLTAVLASFSGPEFSPTSDLKQPQDGGVLGLTWVLPSRSCAKCLAVCRHSPTTGWLNSFITEEGLLSGLCPVICVQHLCEGRGQEATADS